METTSREQARLDWTRAALGDRSATLERASADASFRSYWRARSHGDTHILMDAPPDREDLGPWLDIAARLVGAGLLAPRVLASDAEHGFILMSDLGDALYLPALNADSASPLYDDAMRALLRMQTTVDASDLPPYDEGRLVAEMELMPTWFLERHLGFASDCGQWDVVEVAFRTLAESALRQEQVFVHRDFHSRNLLLAETGGPGILDFQDAVRGPITYDLVSLLRDCYIEWPEAQVLGLAEQYRQQLVSAGLTRVDAATFRRGFDLMGLQRHIKVLGIFCRLWYRDGKAGYLQDLPLVWKYVRDVGQRYAEIAPLVALVETAMRGRDISLPSA